MSFNELRWVEEVVNLFQIVLIFGYSLIIDVGDKALTQLLDIIYRNINVHLLLRLLHEIIFRQATVNNLLRYLICGLLGQINGIKVLRHWSIRLTIIILSIIIRLHHRFRLGFFHDDSIIFTDHGIAFCIVACEN